MCFLASKENHVFFFFALVRSILRVVTKFAIERRDTHTATNKTKHTRYARVITVMVGLVKRRAQVAHELKRESNPLYRKK